MSFEFHNSIITKRRVAPFPFASEAHTIENSVVQLSEIPDSFQKVTVSGQSVAWAEKSSGIPSENEYVVDYDSNFITFHSSREGLQLQFDFYKTGMHYVPISMIYTQTSNGEVVQTLQDVVEGSGEASTVLSNLNSSISTGNSLNSTLNTTISSANTAISNSNTAKTNLDNSNTAAQNTKTILDGSNITAQATKNNLDSSISLANLTKTNLDASILNVNSIKSELEDSITDAQAIKTEIDSSIVVNSEATRNSNESARIISENNRIIAENTRIPAELSRNTAESTRSSAESLRIANESTRGNAENTRISSESVRVSAESSRVGAENSRVSAEANRSNTYNSMYTNPKGIKTTYALLPSSGNVLGDSWHVTSDTDATKNGHWRWSGTAWIQWYQFNPSGVAVITSLNDIDIAQASIIRNQRHSGCLAIPAITTGSTTNLNSITISETIYSVNGYEIKMPLTVVTLPDPPTTGTWDDLVFLETYFPANGNGYTMSGRYRTVSNVNFNTYTADGFSNSLTNSSAATNQLIQPQGGNLFPLNLPYVWSTADPYWKYASFMFNGYRAVAAETSIGKSVGLGDIGLYVAGTGDTLSKTALLTYDGYVYAIPLFRVKRRNSSGFSPSNPNGARNYITSGIVTISPSLNPLESKQTNVSVDFYNALSVGDWLAAAGIKYHKVLSKDGSNLITIQNLASASAGTTIYYLASDRPDNTYSNVIDSRDIPPSYDLRHRVQAQFNYDYELKKASDQFMRGELSPKKMLKTYHGIPKTEIDANTVFYASLDGTTVAEVGGALTVSSPSFKPMPTGSGSYLNNNSTTPVIVANLSATQGSIDVIVNLNDFAVLSNGRNAVVTLLDAAGYSSIGLAISTTSVVLTASKTQGILSDALNLIYAIPSYKGLHHIRVTWVISGLAKIYFDGVMVASISYVNQALTPTQVILGNGKSTDLSYVYPYKGTISDISISNIDRGSLFPNLPADFISGDAQIMPAYTEQRRILSEAQMTQTVNGIVKVGTTGSGRGLATSRASGSWVSGDTVTVTGMAGELISGVFDSDTALATIVKDMVATDTVVYLDDVSKLSVGDVVMPVKIISTTTAPSATITAIDTINKTITFGSAPAWVIPKYSYVLMEITASSSIPKVTYSRTGTAQAGASTTITLASTASAVDDFYNGLTLYITSGTGAGQSRVITDYVGSTKVATVAAWVINPDVTSVYAIYGIVAVGTWTNLGTNVATFTLGTNLMLTNQDLQIDYSVIMPAGQPALIAPTTTTLGGEAGFRLPYANQTIIGDFANKVLGSTWGNPNIAKTLSAIVANNPAPSTFVNELVISEYAKMTTQDGVSTTFSTSVNGEQACVLLSFDLIKIAERKLGCKIPRRTVADKITWLKANVPNVTLACWVNGSGIAGTKSYLSIFNTSNSWRTPTNTQENDYNGSSDLVKCTLAPSPITYLQADGFIYFLAYADPSNGVTPSTINVDYASLDIKFANKVVNAFRNVVGSASSVVVRDDFANKTAGDVTGNPNIVKIAETATLLAPSNAGWVEQTTNGYSQITSLDNTLLSSSTLINSAMKPTLFSFNIIREFEDRFGSILAIDKRQYVIDNLGSVTCNWWGYGSSPTGNGSSVKGFFDNAWIFSGDPHVTASGSITKLLFTTSVISKMIDANGFAHFIAYADPSDGITASTIYTDYCNIELTLKSSLFPSGYDVLVPENVRRDASSGAVLLVNKQTKEVQSLFPISFDLNLCTYSEYIPSADILSATTDVTVVAECENWLLSDLSSSVGSKIGAIHPWGNIAFKTNNDNLNMYGELGYTMVRFSSESKNLNVGSKIQVSSVGFANNYWKQYALNTISKPMVGICSFLVVHNSELKLFLFSKYSATGGFVCDGTGVGMLVKLQGSPLIKSDTDGVVRSGVNTPTNVWKSGELEVLGYVDHATRKLITTNNSI